MNLERRLVDHVVALFVTFHLGTVVLHLIPTPPRADDAALRIPEVAAEIDWVVQTLHDTNVYDGSKIELRADLIAAVRQYKTRLSDATWFTRVYLSPIGGRQTWNMFGGNPKRQPKVLMVDILVRGEDEFVSMRDGRWGGDHVEHRHRKIGRNLSVGSRHSRRRQYSAFLANKWNLAHPDRPAQKVRLSFMRYKTLTAAEVWAGQESPPTKRVMSTTWKAP